MSNRMMYATDAERKEIAEFQRSLHKSPMNRTYENMVTNTAKMFVGREVERTAYYNELTLFVVGSPQDQIDLITEHAQANKCTHIFFGANHSYEPETLAEAAEWTMAISQLAKQFNVSIDIGSEFMHYVWRTKLNEVKNICIQFRLEIPDLAIYNDLTMIKIDDSGFRHSNPGIWTHKLADLKSSTAFTPWDAYKQDRIVK